MQLANGSLIMVGACTRAIYLRAVYRLQIPAAPNDG